MHNLSKLLIVAVCCLPSVVLAQARKEPVKESKIASPAPAPVSATPERTTASFGDWVLRCEGIATQTKRACEVAHMITMQGQNSPVAQVAIGKQAPNEGVRLTIVLPPNIAITAKPHVTMTRTGAAPIELVWQRCLPGACFASLPVSNALISDFGAQTEPGRISFKNAADQEVALPLSFRGLSQAMAALTKEQ